MEGPGWWAQADVEQPLPLGGKSRHPGILEFPGIKLDQRC